MTKPGLESGAAEALAASYPELVRRVTRRADRVLTTLDLHTAGEPFRIVVSGLPAVPGNTMAAKAAYAKRNLEDIRRLVTSEPRGHADMYGCFVTDPVERGSSLGALFFDPVGLSPACGHGTIALATAMVELELLPPASLGGSLRIDVPSGTVEAEPVRREGKVECVHFRNVPASVCATDLKVATQRGNVSVDVAYGGAFFAFVSTADFELSVELAALGELIALGREIKALVDDVQTFAHPQHAEISEIDGVVWVERLGGRDVYRERNVTVFGDGAFDRSPCGSGTSARLALLHAQGQIQVGEEFVNESLIGTCFRGKVLARTEGATEVATQVTGSAYVTGCHTFVLDSGDPLAEGFRIR